MEDPPIRTWGNDDNNQTKRPLGLCNDHNWSVLQHKTRVRACGPFGTGELHMPTQELIPVLCLTISSENTTHADTQKVNRRANQ